MRKIATVRLRGEARLHVLRWLRFFLLVLSLALIAQAASAQSAGDYRSAATGDWNQTSTWQTYNGSTWVAAASTPTFADGARSAPGIRSPTTRTWT